VLRGINLEIGQGECYGLVGESGCGKSTAAYSVLRYLPATAASMKAAFSINGKDILDFDREQLRDLRRTSVAMVYQDPGKALNPSIRIGPQVEEVFELAGVAKPERAKRAADILSKVRISDPQSVMQRYPHQLSGGMQQRVAIAMALASEPTLLVLDEPTTGLDATVEADVLDLILDLRREFNTSILFISHNLGVIAKMCDRVGVLYAGQLVEQGKTDEIFKSPRHPYTVGLLRCLPQRGRSKSVAPLTTIPGFLPTAGAAITGCVFASRCLLADDKCTSIEPEFVDLGHGRNSKCHYPDLAANMPMEDSEAAVLATDVSGAKNILVLENVSKTFGTGAAKFRALNDVSLELKAGETLGDCWRIREWQDHTGPFHPWDHSARCRKPDYAG